MTTVSSKSWVTRMPRATDNMKGTTCICWLTLHFEIHKKFLVNESKKTAFKYQLTNSSSRAGTVEAVTD
jgi:hypothetical protein